MVTKGTDTHMLLVNTYADGIKGREAERMLERCNIIVNRNFLPFDTTFATGIRIGTAAITSRGFMEVDITQLCSIINSVLKFKEELSLLQEKVSKITKKFPTLNVWS